MRALIVFGNGLGRAIDSEYFDFQAGMNHAWNSEDGLTARERHLISTAIPSISEEAGPRHEDDLLGVQIAQTACQLIQHIVGEENIGDWLTEEAQSVEDALEKYQFLVADYFQAFEFSEENQNYKAFSQRLVEFIDETASHVATLNYDSLLYAAFNEYWRVGQRRVKLCNGFSGKLRDGYTINRGFSRENLERHHPRRSAYYLHLHGSPLFIDNAGSPIKIRRNQVLDYPNQRRHVVLAHGRFKPSIIAASSVLQMYWKALEEAINEAEQIILFGYRGGDTHLHEKIKRKSSETIVRVVQRAKADEEASEKSRTKWNKMLGGNVDVIELENILEFEDWMGDRL